MKARKRDDETMGEALVRLAGGPHPSAVAGLLSDPMHDAIDARGEGATTGRTKATDLVDGDDDP